MLSGQLTSCAVHRSVPAERADAAGVAEPDWLLAEMLRLGTSVATARAEARVVLAALDRMSFVEPLLATDDIVLESQILMIGRSSMRVGVEVFRCAPGGQRSRSVVQAVFTFVALGEDGRPQRVPELAPVRR